MNRISVTLQNAKDIKKNLQKAVETPAKKAVEYTTKDIKRDVPRIVGRCVAEVYNVKAAECTPPQQKVTVSKKTGKTRTIKRAAKVTVTGETIDSLSFTYEGRNLTVARKGFGMIPAKPQKPGVAYTVTAKIIKERVHTFSTSGVRYWVQHGHNTDVVQLWTAPGKRHKGQVVHTSSIPAMIETPKVYSAIQSGINEKTENLLKKNLDKVMRKN